MRFAPYVYAWGHNNHAAYKVCNVADVERVGVMEIILAFYVDGRYNEIINWKDDIRRSAVRVRLALGGACGRIISDKPMQRQVAELVHLIRELDVDWIDVDIEGQGNADAVLVCQLVSGAVAETGVRVSLTLPVEWTGLGAEAVHVMEVFHQVPVSMYNLMVMDFYTPYEEAWGVKHIQILKSVQRQLGIPWSKLGVCPMIGRNDDGTYFTLDDWDTLLKFARSVDLGLVTFWALNRDQAGTGGIDTHSSQPHDYQYTERALLYTR